MMLSQSNRGDSLSHTGHHPMHDRKPALSEGGFIYAAELYPAIYIAISEPVSQTSQILPQAVPALIRQSACVLTEHGHARNEHIHQ